MPPRRLGRSRRASVIALAALVSALVPADALATSGPPGGPGSWTLDSGPSPTGSWYAVEHADGQWIAIGHGSVVATSPDGTTWTEHPAPSGDWQAMADGDGRLVALSSSASGPHEMTSTNGTDWTSVSGPAGQWSAITYGQGRFVAVSSGGQIVTSTDGTTWTTSFSRRADDFTGVAHGDGRFVAVDGAQGDTLLSLDGVHWSFSPAPEPGLTWGSVAWGNGNFVAFDGSGTGDMATTVLGSTWVLRPYAPAQDVIASTFGCNAFVGVGQPTGTASSLLSSPTGTSWSASAVPADAGGQWTSVAYGDGHYVAVDAQGDIATAPSGAYCGATIPSAPQQVSGNVSSGQVWTYMHPSAVAGGSTVTGYRVNLTNGTTTWHCPAAVYFQPNCIIKHLTNREVYDVTTQAKNSYGYSVPTDPEWVFPVASWAFDATATQPVVLAGAAFTIQLSGVVANSEGIYPVAVVTVDVGDRVLTCRPSPFGECLLTTSETSPGSLSIRASYTGYGVAYRSPTRTVDVASVVLPTGTLEASQSYDVTVRGGAADSSARVTIGGSSFATTLDGSGDGTITLTAPASPGTYTLAVSDDGAALESPTVTVGS